jgi:hypothetical protein
MIVRYIKHIVSLATPMSSFYVTVGLNRLLFSYSTSEVQAAYELVANRFLGPDQYRRAKSFLTNQLRVRFHGLLELIKGPHGEVRFRTLENQDRWIPLVDKCLSMFTPWSTNRLCSGFTLDVKGNDRLRWNTPALGESEADRDAAEMNRCHIFIEPSCRRRLVTALELPAPESKLALPRFMMRDKTDDHDSDGSGLTSPGLSPDERKQIIESVAATDQRRRRTSPDSVKIFVDGVEYSRLALTRRGQVFFELEAGQRLIEIRGRDEAGEMLLGTHLISYVNGAFASANAFLFLTNGRLDLAIAPVRQLEDPQATLTLRFEPRFHLAWRTEGLKWRSIRTHALTGLAAAAITWALASAVYTRKMKWLQTTNPQPSSSNTLSPPGVTVESHVLISDKERIRGSRNSDIPQVRVTGRAGLIRLELPIFGQAGSTLYRATLRPFPGNRELLTENALHASNKSDGAAVTMAVPTDLLQSGTYYTVQLNAISTSGNVAEVDRFTFQVVGGK